jgi:hypothetical protein
MHPKYSISTSFCLEDPLSHFVVFASIKSNFLDSVELGEGFWIFSKDYQVVISVGWFFEFLKNHQFRFFKYFKIKEPSIPIL